ncbi:MAG: c-type cytochrome [Deltaproteobacteria bacterium]|jgi:cytochrome c oxidase cbb3-type subunit III|nr:c-type cytochrome [Deltaproteobacteria bacterium]MBT6435596.1 c-type cytochrome [Deltaproteobacteria bacterium]MBT6489899.1 c-type cytochrome [Deltaproteobacteria bacterium]
MKTVWTTVFLALWICACEPAEVTRGREHYENLCALCHGDEGEGYVSPKANALTNQDFIATASDEFLKVAIEQGRPETKMGAYGVDWLGPLDAEGVSDLIAFLRSYQEVDIEIDADWTASDDGAELAPGLELYASQCAFCHGATGEGDVALSLNNRTFLSSVSDDFLRYAIARGRRGTAMGAYDGSLSAKEIADLVLAIRSFAETTGE